ncbi:TonB-dependent receptor [Shewanella denitrificans OS217]|jgi:iron complex outermembrane recepter protein|uniref:TonB-dependent receptor n=1 Tax=Shewanella denitrificans (strain OS217 / ATCC BAA-1090 / DSM 15013) TaxID=318161 RepID=Q12RL5_SHEDO|nr:TonB-dependent receptor [Shewanella denitrificans]ABE53911.1 TonB-dependent receptor [Shewanella denitrificans OS217]
MEQKMFKKKLLVAAILCTPIMSPVNAAVDAQPMRSIEVIKVVGEKTERSLKDTTSSVSVIDEDKLASGQYLSVSNALSEVPNLVTLTGSVPDIRGISGNGSATGFNSFTGGAKARVSTLVDGVAEPFVADMTGDSGLWDIEQVEVFRGPQSTINGRNSIGGTIFVKTKDPTFDWNGAVRGGYRNQQDYIDSAVMLSGPIFEDQLAFRISGQNLTGNTFNKGEVYAGNPAHFDLNELISRRWRGKLLWQPTGADNFTLLYSFTYNDEKGDTGRNYFSGDNPWAYKPLFQRYIETESNTHSVKIDYRLNDDYSFDLLAAYIDYDWGFEGYESVAAAEQQVIMQDKSYTLDGKFNFGLQNPEFNGFVGLSYYKREQDFSSSGGVTYVGDDSSSSHSIYGEVSYALTEQWKIIAGGRVEKEQQIRNFAMSTRGRVVADKLDDDHNIALPKLVLQYALNQDTTLAVSARSGYNAGGGALSFADNAYYYYEKETVDTFELSSRSSFDDGNINISSNVFYNNFDGYQASNNERKITNIDEAVTYGLELEAGVMLNDDWQLNSGLGLLKSEIKAASPSYGDIIGNELNSAPKITANIGLKYWVNDELTLGLSGNYVGEYYADINNTTERVAGDYVVSRLNLDYQNDQWRVSGFVNNLFDEQALTVNEPANRSYPQGYAAIIEPRAFGVSVTYSF